jgi:hypothetical protein
MTASFQLYSPSARDIGCAGDIAGQWYWALPG